MKKRHLAKKTVAVALAALMAAGSLTACGGSGDSGAADSGSEAADSGDDTAEEPAGEDCRRGRYR